jgi:natural product biosynthesis luciferase-like monooxygenase protein
VSTSPSFRCVLLGEQSLMIECGERLRARGHGVIAVVSDADRPRAWAREHDLPLFDHHDTLAAEDLGEFDLLLNITWLRMLPPKLLERPQIAAINFHDGPLPRYAGLNAPAWALLHGEARHGVSWHRMAARADAGELLVQEHFDIAKGSTAFELNTRCYEAGLNGFERLLDALESGQLTPIAQDFGQRSYFGANARPLQAAVLDFRAPAAELERQVRALDFGPYPNPLLLPRLRLPSGDMLVRRARALDGASGTGGGLGSGDARPGSVLRCDAQGLVIACAEGALRIETLSCLEGGPIDLLTLAAKLPACIEWAPATHRVGPGPPLAGSRPGTSSSSSSSASGNVQATVSQGPPYARAVARGEREAIATLRAIEPLRLPFADVASTPVADAASSTVPPMISASTSTLRLASGSATASAPAASGLQGVASSSPHSRIRLRAHGVDGVSAALLAIARCACIDALPLAIATTPAPDARLVTPLRPALLRPDYEAPLARFTEQLHAAIARADSVGGVFSDLFAREPGLRGQTTPQGLPLRLQRVASIDACTGGAESGADSAPAAAALTLLWAKDGQLALASDGSQLSASALRRLADAIDALHTEAESQPGLAAGLLSLLSPEARAQLFELAPGEPYASDARSPLQHTSIDALLSAQAAATPEREALCFEGERLSYAELEARATRLARRLAAAGVKPGDRVGLLLQRGVELVVGLIATLKAGAAYVPLDPLYPAERLRYMAEDAQIALLLTDAKSAPLIAHANTLDVAADSAEAELPPRAPDPDALAYLIYTSGSTGQPKGVMVRHSNVLHFFDGMDAVLGEGAGTWLAVTSISFDISVLELLWTLARGYRVVLYADARRQKSRPSSPSVEARPIEFGLFFWNVASEAELQARDKYRLLLDAARFADTHGFCAVWTPERHFASFGGLYPNPAVTSAALATITERVALRAGSCVVPLHHPIRIAEEWAVVDNLSNGRVGLSIAAGWAAPDFALRPENHARAKQVMFESAEQVQRLWRGETLRFPGPQGDVEVRTLPRPVQAELPLWVTTAGNPETFAEAGRLGANVLTHLLGQTVEEVRAKIAAYRRARREAGHAGRGTVTLMLHSFIGDSRAAVEAAVRGPMKDYLRSAMALVKAAAWHFPTFKQQMNAEQGKNLDAFFAEANEADMDALLEFAFQRYFGESGLFGTPEDALAMVERVAAVDVDEIACLIDFGIDAQTVLDHLPRLDRLRALSAERGIQAAGAREDHSLPALLDREGVTHVQCTPSMAAMLVEDPACATGLAKLDHLLLGGEALPPALAQRLAALGVRRISNVYGPTETTVWSAADRVDADALQASTPIGRPLRGQSLYVLDPRQQPLPPGLTGELVIGGGGVTAGYWQRPELTRERFLPDPFRPLSAEAWMYRTGDLGRLREDGRYECLGRVDSQVKIRGYRIELGEIEAKLCALPGIAEAAVVLREDTPGDQRLIAYVRAPGLDASALEQRREALSAQLPEFMRPSAIVGLAELPRTPNGKLDRRALPAPRAHVDTVGPTAALQGTEAIVAELWCRALGRSQVGSQDNFFDLGGHSLLVVQLLGELRQRFDRPIQMTDLFRHTTVESLARFLGDSEPAETAADRARARAQGRQALLARRHGGVGTTP